MNPDDLHDRLLATFLAELDEQVGAMNDGLLALERELGDAAHLAALFRSAHTIKGAARIVGSTQIELACHALEDYFAALRDGRLDFDPAHATVLFDAVDALNDAGRRIRASEPLADAPVARVGDRVAAITGGAPPLPEPQPPSPRKPPPGVTAANRPPAAAPARTTRPADDAKAGPTRGDGGRAAGDGGDAKVGDTIRVESSKVEALHNRAGELVIAATRLEDRLPEIGELSEWIDAWLADERVAANRRTSASANGREADALARVERLRAAYTQIWRALRDDVRGMRRASSDTAGAVLELRLRPIGDALEALPRAARDVAAASGRRVVVEIEGESVQADRLVVDALREPLLHLVRNAVDHGIEDPEERRLAGKPETGTVRVKAELVEGRVRITVTDDGRGLDADALREQLRTRGQRVPQSDRDLVRTIFAGGVSTRGSATSISGRGVGLDLVRASVERVRGSVNVRWKRGKGTSFILDSPPSPTALRAVLVACGNEILAIPSLHLDRLLRVKHGAVRNVDGRPTFVVEDEAVPLVPLATILGAPLSPPPSEGSLAVALLEVADRRLGVIVDDFVAEQDIVVRTLEGAAASVPHLGGGALLASGRIALVLHAPAVVYTGLGAGDFELPGRAGEEDVQRARVLVVDDSITTRALEQSVLEAAGYSVTTAVDGYDGWRKLQEGGADLVVADVEMPRMDGFTLCETIRGSDRFAELPVILVTALESPEYRARGLAAGADAYLTKAAFDQQTLLDTIRQLLD